MWRFPRYRVRLSTPAGEHQMRTPLVFVANNEPLLPGGRRARLDAGRLFVCAAPAAGRVRLLGVVARAFLGRMPASGLTCAWGAEVVVDVPRRHVWVAMDGEVRRVRTPLVYRLQPRALQVLAPPGEAA
jgi:diacylglycerol kinase family enzyme